MDEEESGCYISQFEFAKIVERLDILQQFKHTANRPGKSVVNKFETVITEVVGSKYDSNLFLDFENCLLQEKQKIRSAYARIETTMRKNQQKRKPLSHDLPSDKAFISSTQYPTLVIFPQRKAEEERYHFKLYCWWTNKDHSWNWITVSTLALTHLYKRGQ